jgi:quercetin 2,3-dioxygenase
VPPTLGRGFHALETLNEEHLGPGTGLSPLPERVVEIITYVREGTLVYQDEAGGRSRLGPGEFERTSVGSGSAHRALKGSSGDLSHSFQSCITTGGSGPIPEREQRRFPIADREGILRLVVSPDGRDTSLRIRQDVRLYSSILLLGHHLVHELGEGRGAWLHVVQGRVHLREFDLGAGDGAAFENEAAIAFTARAPAEVLLFDLA